MAITTVSIQTEMSTKIVNLPSGHLPTAIQHGDLIGKSAKSCVVQLFNMVNFP